MSTAPEERPVCRNEECQKQSQLQRSDLLNNIKFKKNKYGNQK